MPNQEFKRCRHIDEEFYKTPKYLVKAVVKSSMRIMPPAYDNVNFVGYTPEDVYDFINNKRPTSIAVYTLSPDVTDATDWVGAAKKHKADMEEDIDRKTFERLKEKFGDK